MIFGGRDHRQTTQLGGLRRLAVVSSPSDQYRKTYGQFKLTFFSVFFQIFQKLKVFYMSKTIDFPRCEIRYPPISCTPSIRRCDVAKSAFSVIFRTMKYGRGWLPHRGAWLPVVWSGSRFRLSEPPIPTVGIGNTKGAKKRQQSGP